MFDVTLLGTGGMAPLYNRNLTSMYCFCEGSALLVDCGEGTQMAMQKGGLSPNPIDVICITHSHADHISGLMGLFLAMENADRTKPITIIAHTTAINCIKLILQIIPKRPYPINFIPLSKDEEVFDIKPYTITAFKVNHSVPCYGFSVDVKRLPKFDVERAKKLPIPVRMWNLLQHGKTVEYEGNTYTPDMVMGDARKGLKVTYCTDTRPVPSIIKNATHADLFICEGMYGDKDKEQDAKSKKHMLMSDAAQIARIAKPQKMWLTHFSPSMPAPMMYLDETRKIFKNTFIVPDVTKETLVFDDE